VPATELLVIRVSKETKELWREVLYDFKKKGHNADWVLKNALLCLRQYYCGAVVY